MSHAERVDVLEASLSAQVVLTQSVTPPLLSPEYYSTSATEDDDSVHGRDIAYWYPIEESLNTDSGHNVDAAKLVTARPLPGQLVYITSKLTVSKTKPPEQSDCVCGIVVSPDQPWAQIKRPDALDMHRYVLVCIKGQVPVEVSATTSPLLEMLSAASQSMSTSIAEWLRGLCTPQPGDLIVPDASSTGASRCLPFYEGSDCCIGQIVSTEVPSKQPACGTRDGSRGKGTQTVLAHVHMPSVQVKPRYERCWYIRGTTCSFIGNAGR